DFTAKISSVAGQDLTWFIDEWVKQPNHPAYQNSYGITNLGGGNWRVSFLAYQTLSNTPFHKMPLTIKVSFTSGPDTTVRVMNDVNSQMFNFNFNRQPSSVVFDPNNDIVIKTASLTVGINNNSNTVPAEFALHQNYPNPFNPVTSIRYDVPRNSHVSIKVFDVTGKQITELVSGEKQAGIYETSFDASDFASGIYFYRMEAGKFSSVLKMILIK
ncbi:MAG: T9SS type A sorting domain-containing protein, partial [Ignavibacteria bacterium]|nr:T9SS type A sorting domain-containing protein [Ignavibacteria bacterium]